MTKPFVSVLIDTYNHERFIEQAVASALEQDFPQPDREIIVVDDGSTDRTPEILRKFEPHIRLIRKCNGGQASAFNAGIPQCQGEVVAFLDGDDWWEKTKVSEIVSAFSRNESGAIGHGLYEVDESGKKAFINVPTREYACHLHTISEGLDFIELRSYLGTSRLAVRKSVLEKILPIPESLVIEADEFLATLATAISGCVVLDQPLASYRLHSNNLYQFVEFSCAKVERKLTALECLARDLPVRLKESGVLPEIVRVVTLPNAIEAMRSRLALGRGNNRETIRVEQMAFRYAFRHTSLRYRVFHLLVLVLAGLLPPRVFYRGRRWYARRGLARVREHIAAATPVDSLVARKEWSLRGHGHLSDHSD
jgi:glycosyltransferase involved in cell wall biosynthesis